MKVLDKFAETLGSDEKSNPSIIEKKFKEFCKDTGGKDDRFVSIAL